jgi:tetratricopeptide (TPR) repeat protein
MRGPRHLPIPLVQNGQYDEALQRCDQLEKECADAITATVYRANIFLNIGRWKLALDNAARLRHLWPSESFIAAFAAFELGRQDEAMEYFLHAALNHPRAARMLLGYQTREPNTRPRHEVEDHNEGVHLTRDLHDYLNKRRTKGERCFKRLLGEAKPLIEHRHDAIRRWHLERSEDRADFDTMQEMASPEFAQQEARRLWTDDSASHPFRTGV